MFRAAVGQSESPDSADAITEALEQCLEALQGASPKAGILYCGFDYDHQLILDLVQRRLPGLELIGCSSDGEIGSGSGYAEDSLVLTLFAADEVKISAGIGARLGRDPNAATKLAVQSAMSKIAAEPILCFTCPESTTTTGDAVLRGLRAVLPESAAIFGGKAADRGAGSRTYQFYNGEVYMDAVPVLLFAGPLKYGFGFGHGWTTIGKRRTVTKAQGGRVLECDGEPVLDLYRRYLGDHSLVSAEYPLAVFKGDSFHLRTPSTYAEREGAIIFSGEIGVLSEVQFAEATRGSLLCATKKAAADAIQNYPGDSPALALVYSCAIRKYLLGTQVSNEAESVMACLPEGTSACGLYCFGEFFSPPKDAQAGFHNASIVAVVLGVE